MNQPRVQIIVPVYNAERFLRDCLDSIKAQTYEAWEAILIDDASTDSSGDIIKEYIESDGRFLYVRQENNGGVSNARNRAISMLSGEYTAFLDSDDYWEPDMLSELVEKAESTGSDVVQCRFMYDFQGGRQVIPGGAFKKDMVLSGDDMKKVYIRMMTGINMNHVCMKLIKTDIIKNLRFNTGLKTAEDLQLCVRLFEGVKKYSFINKPMYHYRRSEESLTGKGLSAREKLRANRAVSADIKKALPLWGMDKPVWRVMCDIRPGIITVSKVYRIVRERVFSAK